MLVLKIGGNEIDNPDFVVELAKIAASLQERFLLVHGGGKEIRDLQERLGMAPMYIDGLRVTDAESLSLVKMVLAGRVNKRLVATFSNAGLDTMGMSGVDRASIRVKKLEHPDGDLGFVGEVTDIRAEVFQKLLDDSVTPIVSPICYGAGGGIFNVNADSVAVALAIALQADELVFVSNVPGVLQEDKLLPRLNAQKVADLTKAKVIYGGMIPKIKAALQAVDHGVAVVRITNLAGLLTGEGTRFSQNA